MDKPALTPATHPLLATRLVGAPLMLDRRHLERLLSLPAPPLAQMDTERQLRTFGYFAASGVAVVPVLGTVMKRGTGLDWLDEWLGVVSVDKLAQTLKTALADPAAESILLEIDSPGGETCGVFDCADLIYASRGQKPLWAIANEWAFSAGYLLASAADRVVLPRTGGVGSIGVYGVRVDVTGLDAQMGVRWDIVTYGARKADGHPHKPVTDDELDDLQREITRLGELFVATVARNRGLSADVVRAQEARCFYGPAGVAAQLADDVATFEDTVMELATMPRGAAPAGGRRMSTDAKPQGGAEVINLADHRTEVASATAAGEAAATARASTFANMCTAAKRMDLLAGFIADPKATVETVAKALADAAAAASAEEIANQAKPVTTAPASGIPAASGPPTVIDTEKSLAHWRRSFADANTARVAARR